MTVFLQLAALAMAPVGAAQPAADLRNVKVGDAVPDFTAVGLSGRTLRRGDFKGKVLLLVFARPGQKSSITALQVAERIRTRASADRLAVLAVSSEPDAGDALQAVASREHLTFPLALDPQRKMYGDFGLVVTPTTLLIDAGGVLRFELPHLPPDFERKLGVHLDWMLGKIDRKRHDELLTQVEHDAGDWNNAARARLALARSMIERKSYQEALGILEPLHASADSIPVSAALATVYLALDRVEDAGKVLDPLLAKGGGSPILALPAARLELRRGNDDQAEAYLQRALKMSPTKGPILYELGRIYERRGETSKALDCYRRALEDIYGPSS